MPPPNGRPLHRAQPHRRQIVRENARRSRASSRSRRQSVIVRGALKRAFIRVEIVRKGSDPHFKYHMFKRLNTGGELLSEQQVRNSTIRMLSSDFPEFLIAMSKVDAFLDCTEYLTQERLITAFDQELVLRFFALKNRRDKFKHEVSDFLTEYMEDIADPSKPYAFDYQNEAAVFRKTFLILQRAL